MSYTYNRWKSSTVFGNFQVSDTPDSSILANGTFDRNLLVKGDIEIGNETSTTDPITSVVTYTQTGGNIKFNLNGVTYTITKSQLLQLQNTLATQSYVTTSVNDAIASLINNSPVALDTLQELANALGNDPNFATTISTNLGLKAPIDSPTFTGTVSGITKAMVGLANVDNTSDANKPISTATQTALNLKANLAGPTFTGTTSMSTLNATGLITASAGLTVPASQNLNLNGNLIVSATTISPTVLSYLSGATSNLQSQIIARGVLSGTNAWTGTNTFNSNLPTSTLTPTTGTQLITKTFADATYQTITGMSSYLTTSTASTTYQTISGMSSYLTTTNASTTYGALSGTNAWSGTNTFNTNLPTSTLTPTSGSQLITKTFGDATYQTISGMSSYLTTANASSTYQTITGMSSYLTTSTASSTYQPISGMSSYLTTANASTTYGALSGTNAWSGTNTFNSSLPTSTLTPTLANQFITKTYADSTYTTAGNIIGANNAWTGTNTFNTNLPTSTLTPTLGTQLITKTFGDATYQSISGMSNYLTTANASSTYLTTANASSTYQTISGMSAYPTLSGANTFTNLNAINRAVFTGRNNADSSATANIENTTGCHIQWNRPNAGGLTFFMNNRANNTQNGGFRFQRYGGGVFIDEPFQILDNNIAMNINTSLTGTFTSSGLITANGGLTLPSGQVLTLTGNISANSTTITPTVLSHISTLSSNAQTQINAKANSANPTFTGTITAPIINASGLITANGGLTIPATKILTLTGDISANSTTISPTELSYLDNVTSNIQTQLNARGQLSAQNLWTNVNNFNRLVISNNNNTTGTYSRTSTIENQQGCHIQWNRDGSDGSTYIMNHKGEATGNGDFIFQRYNGSVYLSMNLL